MIAAKRLENFSIQIQGRLLNNLGINMYGSLGKCLVEFAANAYDGDSPWVNIVLDVDAINTAREKVRDDVRAAAKAAGKDPPKVFENPLPDVTVTIADCGHGMLPEEVQNRFLPINRDRRADTSTNGQRTEAGKRFVMGRKGIGKLSAFGAASKMVVRTKRAGETFATLFTLLEERLVNASNLPEVAIPAEYEDGLELDEQGTTITLSGLKCDSMKFTLEQLEATLAEAFYPVRSEEFAITINGNPICRDELSTEFVWPKDLDGDGMAAGEVGDDDTGRLPFRYAVKFREKSLPAAKRGARIYCNNRLAFGPTLLDLKTGTHNFMAHQYMECIVEADELDRQEVDLISTDRGDMRRDNDLMSAFITQLTKIMQDAIRDQAKHGVEEAERKITEDPALESIRRQLQTLPLTQRTASREVVKVVMARFGHTTPEFLTIAPLLMRSIGAGEVLVKLIDVARDPKDIERVLLHLLDLKRIEEQDALKIYGGRRDGIAALQALMQDGEDTWVKGERKENDLQLLLKECPWLIDPQLSEYVTSDQNLDKVVSALAKHLRVDEFAPAPDAGEERRDKDLKRPDLVFLLGDVGGRPNSVLIVELKAPNVPLSIEHLSQLKSYMRKVGEWLKSEHPQPDYAPRIRGMLVGPQPDPASKAEGARDLAEEIKQAGQLTPWEVVGLRELIERTRRIHAEMIGALQKKEEEVAGGLEHVPTMVGYRETATVAIAETGSEAGVASEVGAGGVNALAASSPGGSAAPAKLDERR